MGSGFCFGDHRSAFSHVGLQRVIAFSVSYSRPGCGLIRHWPFWKVQRLWSGQNQLPSS